MTSALEALTYEHPVDAALAAALRATLPELQGTHQLTRAGSTIRTQMLGRPNEFAVWRRGWADKLVESRRVPLADFDLQLLPSSPHTVTGEWTARWWSQVADVIDTAVRNGYTVSLTEHLRVVFERTDCPFVDAAARVSAQRPAADGLAARREIEALTDGVAAHLRLFRIRHGSRLLIGVGAMSGSLWQGALSRTAAMAVLSILSEGRTVEVSPAGIRISRERDYDRQPIDAPEPLVTQWTWSL